jgi:putative tricarboxylic transport membrane protein
MKNKVGFSGGVSVLTIGIIFFVYALQYPYESELGPGPGMLPLWLSGILIVLSLAYLYSVILGKDSAEDWPDNKSQIEMGLILGNMSLFVLLTPVIGFVLSSILFLFIFFRRNYHWFKSLMISAGASVFLFLLFTKGFASPLPVNMFGF